MATVYVKRSGSSKVPFSEECVVFRKGECSVDQDLELLLFNNIRKISRSVPVANQGLEKYTDETSTVNIVE